VESVFRELLAALLGVERVSAESNFFEDLGADSLMMTRFCARVRKQGDLPPVSMKDIYRYPTIAALASALTVAPESGAALSSAAPPGSTDEGSDLEGPGESGSGAARGVEPAAVGTPRYVLCGAAQLLVLFGLSALGAFVTAQGYEWVYNSQGLLGVGARAAVAGGIDPVRAFLRTTLFGPAVVGVYLRSVLFVVAGFVGLCALPIVAKWVLIGRWTRRRIRIWSLSYLRFWVVKTLIRTSPLVLFVGTPIYVTYLRLLGAKIGPGVAIFSPQVPVCTDLLTIGEDSVIRKDVTFACYRARAGMIETGPITLGADVLVSEATVLDIDTSMGHWSQLGHASSLHSGQTVPAGATWHGSPAQPTEVDYRKIEPARCGALRRFRYCATRLVSTLFVLGPLLISGLALLFARFPWLSGLLAPPRTQLTSRVFYLDALSASYLLFAGMIFVGGASLVVLPRLLNMLIRPGHLYPLYGLRYSVYRLVNRMTNLRFYSRLFGDSSFVTGYLRGAGYGLRPVVQTGSNFGSEFKQDCSYLSSVGAGTMIADGLSIVNADFTSTSFRVMEVSIGAHNFLGNKLIYPTLARTGQNCLLATKVLVPIDGPLRENVGLLGSPSFEIPRSVERDMRIGAATADLRHQRLTAKNDHNVVTMALYLLVWWLHSAVMLLLGLVAFDRYRVAGVWGLAAAGMVSLAFHIGYWVLVDRCVRGLQALKPQGCSIYDRAFWRHERFWKVCDDRYLLILNGTPFKPLVWRLLGVRIGRRVFDDGAFFPERTLVTIGDDCTLNTDTHIQCHSQEDGAFKSDHTRIGARTTLGVGAFIHYGVTVDDDVELLPDCFVMKGEEIPTGARWGGNPARQM
jgi:non-ribosomal peptide synthetase-like protein